MPTCQLKRLVTFLGMLTKRQRYVPSWIDCRLLSCICKQSVALWMDVMCIPVGDENSRLKSAAIARMMPTYVGAWSVLVLDSDLLTISASDACVEEIFARVVRSAWEGRCWALQQGLLAKNLIIQTADTAFHNADTWNKVQFDELWGSYLEYCQCHSS